MDIDIVYKRKALAEYNSEKNELFESCKQTLQEFTNTSEYNKSLSNMFFKASELLDEKDEITIYVLEQDKEKYDFSSYGEIKFLDASYIGGVKLQNKNMLVDNLFLDDYVYLEIENLKDINSKVIINNHDIRAINQNETEALRNVINLYEKKDDLQNEVKEKFMNGADEYESLKMLHEWWNSIDGSFSITGVGKVIAYINAKRCIPELPDMLW